MANGALVCEAAVPATTHSLLTSFAWPENSERGIYIRVNVQWQDAAGNWTETQMVLDPRKNGNRVSLLHALNRPTSRARITISNAYHDTVTSVRDIAIHFLPAPGDGASTFPAGKVGLIYSDVNQLPGVVQNIRDHYDHFHASARLFAGPWRNRHDAERIVRSLAICEPPRGKREADSSEIHPASSPSASPPATVGLKVDLDCS